MEAVGAISIIGGVVLLLSVVWAQEGVAGALEDKKIDVDFLFN